MIVDTSVLITISSQFSPWSWHHPPWSHAWLWCPPSYLSHCVHCPPESLSPDLTTTLFSISWLPSKYGGNFSKNFSWAFFFLWLFWETLIGPQKGLIAKKFTTNICKKVILKNSEFLVWIVWSGTRCSSCRWCLPPQQQCAPSLWWPGNMSKIVVMQVQYIASIFYWSSWLFVESDCCVLETRNWIHVYKILFVTLGILKWKVCCCNSISHLNKFISIGRGQ